DAHACIMVLIPIDQPNTSLRRDIASKAGSPRKSSSRRQLHLLVPTSTLSPGSRPSRAASLPDGLRPPFTAAPPPRPSPSSRDGELYSFDLGQAGRGFFF